MSIKHRLTQQDKIIGLRKATLAPLFREVKRQHRTCAGLARDYGIPRQTFAEYASGRVQAPNGFVAWLIRELGLAENFVALEVRVLVEREQKEA